MAATTTVGSGKYTYEVDEEWAKLPEGWEMPAAAVYGDSKDRVFCFNRDPEHPVCIFDREGNFISSWGAGLISFAHAIYWTKMTTFGWWTGTSTRYSSSLLTASSF